MFLRKDTKKNSLNEMEINNPVLFFIIFFKVIQVFLFQKKKKNMSQTFLKPNCKKPFMMKTFNKLHTKYL